MQEDVWGGRWEGVEVVDLADMEFAPGGAGKGGDEVGLGDGVYYKGCRCGRERGYEVPVRVLEECVEDGEVVVPCAGCSLWVRVVFAVVEEEEEEGRVEGGGKGEGEVSSSSSSGAAPEEKVGVVAEEEEGGERSTGPRRPAQGGPLHSMQCG